LILIDFGLNVKVSERQFLWEKFNVIKPCSFNTILILPKLDFPKKNKSLYFCLQYNHDSQPCFTLFIIAQKLTYEYCLFYFDWTIDISFTRTKKNVTSKIDIYLWKKPITISLFFLRILHNLKSLYLFRVFRETKT